VPHINVGDLLYAEVAAKTPLGLEAQRHMDSSKTVPDRLLMRLLLERLQHEDCRAQGWVLDGFPHTRKQVGWQQARKACPSALRPC
jgi:adenylate kinase